MTRDIPEVRLLEVLANTKLILTNPLAFHAKFYDKVGDTFIINASLGKRFLITRDAGLGRYVLQKNHRNYKKSTIQTEDLGKYVGKGLLTSNGEHWLKHRRMIQPGFSKKQLMGLLDVMDQAIIDEIKYINEGVESDVIGFLSDLTFQVVAKSLFSNGDIRDKMKRLQQITIETQVMLVKELRQPYLTWWFRLNGSLTYSLDKAKEARSIVRSIIVERKNSNQKSDDLLDMLLSSKYKDGSAMSEQQLIDEVLILFTAGHETTTNVLGTTLYHLATDQDLQEKIYQESRLLESGLVSKMQIFDLFPLTQSCIKEAMRLYPPVYMIDRVAIEDDTYEGLHIPSGTTVLISMYEIHRDQRFWSEGYTYKADRFLKLESSQSDGRYYPFGAGPRMCVGNHFAMYEMLSAIARIVNQYKLSTSMSSLQMKPMISYKPAALNIKFERR